MSWSWRIGRIAGIDVYMHFTFVILLGWVALTHYLANGDENDTAAGVVVGESLFEQLLALAARHIGRKEGNVPVLRDLVPSRRQSPARREQEQPGAEQERPEPPDRVAE
jgi:hypothetical protein